LGVRLIHRSTRRVCVTEIGQTDYAQCKAMLVEAQAAQEAIEVVHTDPQGIVRMTCPVALLHANVDAMLSNFMKDNPRVIVHLSATNRRVDPVGEGIDIALRARPLPIEDSDLVMRILANRIQSLVASPALIARMGPPRTPEDLANWPSLALGRPQENHTWNLLGSGGEAATVHHRPRFVTDDMTALRRAALDGIGAAQLPLMMIREALAQGALIKVLPDWAPRTDVVHAVFPSRRGLLPSVRALVDFLARSFEELDED
jgi:DNA-binding transcriptional LysR family regulator